MNHGYEALLPAPVDFEYFHLDGHKVVLLTNKEVAHIEFETETVYVDRTPVQLLHTVVEHGVAERCGDFLLGIIYAAVFQQHYVNPV